MWPFSIPYDIAPDYTFGELAHELIQSCSDQATILKNNCNKV